MSESRKHVVVVGAGAAGMACAATLAQHPNRFKVTVIEKGAVTGGQATSIPIDKGRFGASWMNNGVQGGSNIFKHTFKFFDTYGCKANEIMLQVSFGKGTEGFWTNCFPTQLVEKHVADIRKFGLFLKLIKWTLPVLGLVPIHLMMTLMFFSKDFTNKMVLPLIALFLGTGNQTPYVPCAIVERLFDDPNMKLWDYDAKTLLPNLPRMVTFGNLHDFYDRWRRSLVASGVVDVRLGTEVRSIVRRGKNGVVLQTCAAAGRGAEATDDDGQLLTEAFDEMVLCIPADAALELLGKSATRAERLVLGGASYYDDITVTHADHAYFSRQYETSKEGKDEFRPMYYTKSYGDAAQGKIEMSFDCSNYQHQLRSATQKCGREEQGGCRRRGGGGDDEGKIEHIYQTIFLDKRDESHWTRGEIDPDKIIREDWWHQLGHRWQHYVRVVPGMMFINGKNHTLYAGSWTLVNMHEVACVSGIAAAYRLGASYTKFDDFARDFFSKYLLLSHGVRFAREESRRSHGARTK